MVYLNYTTAKLIYDGNVTSYTAKNKVLDKATDVNHSFVVFDIITIDQSYAKNGQPGRIIIKPVTFPSIIIWFTFICQ